MDNYSLVFSTGDELDSLFIKGSINVCENENSNHSIVVAIYEKNSLVRDSTIYLQKPDYFCLLDDEKNFEINHIRPGTFELCAFEDVNANYQYDGVSEKIAFYKELIEIGDTADFDLWLFKEEAELKRLDVDVKENGDLSFPLLFSSVIDSKDNEGSIAFSPDEKTIFYTQENVEKDGKLELYKATLDLTSDDYWTNKTKVELNTNGYSIETPCVSPDGKKLYFASNMPGGYGNYDIYEVTINDDNTYGNPVNLGPTINTSEDEKFPNITADNKHLYFSSKGHLNIGGYDIFRSSIVNNKYLQALNLGITLNSRRDDLAFVLVSEDKGYVSTDKSGAGNFDILKFEF